MMLIMRKPQADRSAEQGTVNPVVASDQRDGEGRGKERHKGGLEACGWVPEAVPVVERHDDAQVGQHHDRHREEQPPVTAPLRLEHGDYAHSREQVDRREGKQPERLDRRAIP